MAGPTTNDVATLSAGAAKLTAFSNLLLVSPQSTVGYQPQNPLGLDGNPLPFPSVLPKFVFHYEGEQSTTIESEITDHFIETNSSIQDHIALKPIMITTKGYIGELNNVPPFLLAIAQGIATRLTALTAYAPKQTIAAETAYAAAFFAYQTAANAVHTAISAVASLANLATGQSGITTIEGAGTIKIATNQNKQQNAFQLFYGYWSTRQLFTVQTPWAVFQNCAILRMRAVQEEDTRVISGFEMTFKQMRFTNTILHLKSQVDGRAVAAAAAIADFGVSQPAPAQSVTEGVTSQTAVP